VLAEGEEVERVLVDRAARRGARPGAGATAGEIEADDAEPIEVEPIDQWLPRRGVVLEAVHEHERLRTRRGVTVRVCSTPTQGRAS